MLWLRFTFLERFRDRAGEIDENLAQFYRLNRWRLVGLLGLHLLGWSMGTLEIYVILYVLGEPMPFVRVYLFHALMIVINAAFFFVPLGMGVFEGGHVFLFHLMGLDPKMGFGCRHCSADSEAFLDAGGTGAVADRATGQAG